MNLGAANAYFLGIIISSDLKWNEHTLYIVKKANQRLWSLRRLSKLGASRDTLLNQYHLRIRCHTSHLRGFKNSGAQKTAIFGKIFGRINPVKQWSDWLVYCLQTTTALASSSALFLSTNQRWEKTPARKRKRRKKWG